MKPQILLYLFLVLTFSCSPESTNYGLPEPEVVTNVETAYPDEIGNVSELYFAGQKMTVEDVGGNYIFEGDILFSPEMLSAENNALIYETNEKVQQKSVGRTSAYWPDNTVYYSVDPNLTRTYRVKDAIDHWEASTSLKFVQRTTERNYLYFTTGSGCSSYIGMIGGRQNITLSSSCSIGNTIHEIGHAIGLWHEQSRPDRNRHINILYENIQAGREHNFQTYADSKEFTTDLDFGSIMMYGPYSFSSNGKPTITKKDGSTYAIQRSVLSNGDRIGIESMYPSAVTTTPTYINGELYTIAGLTVLRYYDGWFYYHPRWRYKAVELRDGIWYWK